MVPETSLPIQTSRLTLRRFEPTVFDAYATYHRRGDVYRFPYSSPPSTEAFETQFSGVPFALRRSYEMATIE